MEPAGPASRTARLVTQSRKMANFIREISNYMEPSQPVFTILGQPDKQADPLPYNSNPGRPTHRMI